MDRRTCRLNDEGPAPVVPIGVEPPVEPEPPARSSKLHSAAVFITGAAAVCAVVATVAFMTVGWSGRPRRAVIAILMASVVIFLAGVASSILTAARDTYVKGRNR